MKIAKALKLKNRLAGEISRLKGIVQAKNVREATQKEVYDVKRIATVDLINVIDDLVLVKTVIAMSNAECPSSFIPAGTPFFAIFMMAEIKGYIETLRTVDTKDGTFNSAQGRFGEIATSVPTTYVASLKQVEIDSMIAGFEKKIDDLQDRLDAHNATAEWACLDGISV